MKINFGGELSMGIFGGSVDEAVQGVVEAFWTISTTTLQTEVTRSK